MTVTRILDFNHQKSICMTIFIVSGVTSLTNPVKLSDTFKSVKNPSFTSAIIDNYLSSEDRILLIDHLKFTLFIRLFLV